MSDPQLRSPVITSLRYGEEVNLMGIWVKVPCSACDETGKKCSEYDGAETMDCTCCCHGTGYDLESCGIDSQYLNEGD
jgi:hypothetical protein